MARAQQELEKIEGRLETEFERLLKKEATQAGSKGASEFERLVERRALPAPAPQPKTDAKGVPIPITKDKGKGSRGKKGPRVLTFQDAWEAARQVLEDDTTAPGLAGLLAKRQAQQSQSDRIFGYLDDLSHFITMTTDTEKQLIAIGELMEEKLLQQNNKKKTETNKHRTRKPHGTGAGL